jgi:hypothetical protein
MITSHAKMPQPMISRSSTPKVIEHITFSSLIPRMNSKVNVQLCLGMRSWHQTKDVPFFVMTTSVKTRFLILTATSRCGGGP